MVQTSVGYPGPAADIWALLSDDTNLRAPSPLSYFSIGTAFCYHAQLCRLTGARIGTPRLAQTSRFVAEDDAADLRPFDTHVFLDGGVDEGRATSMLGAAAQASPAYRALASDVLPTHVVEVNRRR